MKGMGMMKDAGKMSGDMGKSSGTPGDHSQNDMSKHSSPEMEKCRKANMPAMKEMIGYATDKESGGSKMPGM